MQEEDWRARESAILALGAISEGCANGLLSHLTEMVRPSFASVPCCAHCTRHAEHLSALMMALRPTLSCNLSLYLPMLLSASP